MWWPRPVDTKAVEGKGGWPGGVGWVGPRASPGRPLPGAPQVLDAVLPVMKQTQRRADGCLRARFSPSRTRTSGAAMARLGEPDHNEALRWMRGRSWTSASAAPSRGAPAPPGPTRDGRLSAFSAPGDSCLAKREGA